MTASPLARRRLLAAAGLTLAVLLAACTADGGAASPTSAVSSADPSSSSSESEAPAGTGPGTDELGRTIDDLEARVAADSADVNALTELGRAYLQRARETGDPTHYGRAGRALDAALALEPDNIDALVGAGVLALARHDFARGLELGERALALNPTSPAALGVLTDAQTELGRYDEAVASVQAMLDLNPDLSSYARVSYQRELHGELDGAIAAMEKSFNAGIAGTENAEYVRVLLGNLYFSRGEIDVAEQIYTESLAARPDFVYALAGLGRVRAAQGETDEAVELFDAVIARNPLPEFVISLGETLEGAGRAEDAQRQYELVGAIEQLFMANGVDVDLDLALFEANHGDDPARAVELARGAYERTPNIRAADALGWALYRAGEFEEAGRYAEESLELGTLDAYFFYHAGAIAAAAGDDVLARQHLERALEINPYFSPLYAPAARELLDELDARSSAVGGGGPA